jgi:hypothetical protein
VVNVPAVAAAAQRHLPRALETLKPASANTTTRSKGWLRSQGGRLARGHKLPEQLDTLRLWDGSPLPSGLRRRGLRVYAPDAGLGQQLAALAADRRARLRSAPAAPSAQGRQLRERKGLGSKGAWWVVRALFGWRAVKTRREGGG